MHGRDDLLRIDPLQVDVGRSGSPVRCKECLLRLSGDGTPGPVGRVRWTVIPAAELATVTHHGTLEGLDLAYGTLAAHVARHALGVAGPIREYSTVADTDTPDSSAWRTKIGVPIFSTAERA
jgi:hypothetical protein